MTGAPSAGGRPDASMDLLNDLIRTPLDPDYSRLGPGSTGGWRIAVALAVTGLMVGAAVATTLRSAPLVQTEREDLVARVQTASLRVDELTVTVAELERGNADLAGEAAPISQAEAQRLSWLEVSTGSVSVIGAGIVIVADDGGSSDPQARVVDADLRQLVNELWRSGAEAIAINGHRISSRTAIRAAGDAITVNYRSLTRPYRIEAIVDAGAFEAGFPDSQGGQWWSFLRQNYGVRYETGRSASLTLAADPGLRLDWVDR